MNVKRLYIAAVITIITFAAVGCSSPKQTGASFSEQLFEARNEYIGDNSADMKLMELLNVNEIGDYEIELQTSKQPYAIKVTFSNIGSGIGEQELNEEMKKNSVLLIALIKNAGCVEWTYSINGVKTEKSMTEDEASEMMGKDVKACGESKAGVEEVFGKFGGSSYE